MHAPQPLFGHEALHPFVPDVPAGAGELGVDPPDSVSALVVGEHGRDEAGQAGVSFGPGAGRAGPPGVETGHRHAQQPAHEHDRESLLRRLGGDELEPQVCWLAKKAASGSIGGCNTAGGLVNEGGWGGASGSAGYVE